MSPLSILTSSFIVGLSGALMPGPLATLTLERSAGAAAEHGPRAALWTAFWVCTGHALLELVIIAALVVGVGNFLTQPIVTGAIGVAGGAVLLWMGWTMVTRARIARLEAVAAESARPARIPTSLLGGALVSISNPYWLLWWATVGATYLSLWTQGSLARMSAFYIGHVAADYVWLLLIAGLVAYGGKLLPVGFYRGLVGVLGAVLALLGIVFASGGVRILLAV